MNNKYDPNIELHPNAMNHGGKRDYGQYLANLKYLNSLRIIDPETIINKNNVRQNIPRNSLAREEFFNNFYTSMAKPVFEENNSKIPIKRTLSIKKLLEEQGFS